MNYKIHDMDNLEHNNMTNNKIFNRNIPSKPIQPYFSVAPVSTKYSVLPILDVRKPNMEPLHQYPSYSTSSVFNPGTNGGPWSAYSANINDESILRNQIYALQHSSQATYIPSSKSDLYNTSNLLKHASHTNQQFPLLFRETIHANNIDIKTHDNSHTFFANHTRQQLNIYEPPKQINLKQAQNATTQQQQQQSNYSSSQNKS
jgi:hypothetical protein